MSESDFPHNTKPGVYLMVRRGCVGAPIRMRVMKDWGDAQRTAAKITRQLVPKFIFEADAMLARGTAKAEKDMGTEPPVHAPYGMLAMEHFTIWIESLPNGRLPDHYKNGKHALYYPAKLRAPMMTIKIPDEPGVYLFFRQGDPTKPFRTQPLETWARAAEVMAKLLEKLVPPEDIAQPNPRDPATVEYIASLRSQSEPPKRFPWRSFAMAHFAVQIIAVPEKTGGFSTAAYLQDHLLS